ncbi:unnamed protein product [Gadus morhua 'NCC']
MSGGRGGPGAGGRGSREMTEPGRAGLLLGLLWLCRGSFPRDDKAAYYCCCSGGTAGVVLVVLGVHHPRQNHVAGRCRHGVWPHDTSGSSTSTFMGASPPGPGGPACGPPGASSLSRR